MRGRGWVGKGAGEFEDLLSLVFIMLSAVDRRLPVIFPNGRGSEVLSVGEIEQMHV